MNVEKYRGLFLEEAREHIDALASELAVEPPVGSAAIDSLFRHAHSIKGMSASMGVAAMRDLAHAMEDLLGLARKQAIVLERPALARLLAAADHLARQLDAFARNDRVPEAPPATLALGEPAARPPGATAAPGHSVPAPLRPSPAPVLEPSRRALVDAPPAAESHATPLELTPAPALVPVVVPAPPAASGPAERSSVRVATRFIDALVERVVELALAQGSLRAALGETPPEATRPPLEQLRRSIDRLREDTMAIRLLSFSSIAADLARTARDAAAATGKPVRFELSGESVSLDRAVLEALVDPLVHVIRNAVDHGIEPAEERRRLGKPADGSVRVAVRREADSVYIAVHDDGRGLDPARLGARAVAEGRLGEEDVARMSRQELLLLATLPGLSTAATVTQLSGRGVGLDLVRSRIEGLGGKIEIDSEPGKGAEITLRAPLTLALQRLFLVRSGGRHFAIPSPRVAGLFELRPHEIRGDSAPGSPAGPLRAALDDDEELPLVRLAEVLGQPLPPADRPLIALLVEARGRRVLLGVEEALAEAELVVRPLGRPLQRLRVFSAAAILAEGSLALVLDADGILA